MAVGRLDRLERAANGAMAEEVRRGSYPLVFVPAPDLLALIRTARTAEEFHGASTYVEHCARPAWQADPVALERYVKAERALRLVLMALEPVS